MSAVLIVLHSLLLLCRCLTAAVVPASAVSTLPEAGSAQAGDSFTLLGSHLHVGKSYFFNCIIWVR